MRFIIATTLLTLNLNSSFAQMEVYSNSIVNRSEQIQTVVIDSILQSTYPMNPPMERFEKRYDRILKKRDILSLLDLGRMLLEIDSQPSSDTRGQAIALYEKCRTWIDVENDPHELHWQLLGLLDFVEDLQEYEYRDEHVEEYLVLLNNVQELIDQEERNAYEQMSEPVDEAVYEEAVDEAVYEEAVDEAVYEESAVESVDEAFNYEGVNEETTEESVEEAVEEGLDQLTQSQKEEAMLAEMEAAKKERIEDENKKNREKAMEELFQMSLEQGAQGNSSGDTGSSNGASSSSGSSFSISIRNKTGQSLYIYIDNVFQEKLSAGRIIQIPSDGGCEKVEVETINGGVTSRKICFTENREILWNVE